MSITITRHVNHTIRIEITPKQLRDLADRAEGYQKKLKVGVDRTFVILDSNNMDTEIKLQVPQPEAFKVKES